MNRWGTGTVVRRRAKPRCRARVKPSVTPGSVSGAGGERFDPGTLAEHLPGKHEQSRHGRGGGRASGVVVDDFERRIAAKQRGLNPRPGYGGRFGPEEGLIVADDGTVLWQGVGEPTSLTGTYNMALLRPGVTLTHFHPGEGQAALSGEDVSTALRTGATFRAFHSNGTWEQFVPSVAGQRLPITNRDLYAQGERDFPAAYRRLTRGKGEWSTGRHGGAEAELGRLAEHLPGKHDQRTHGRGGRLGPAIADFRARADFSNGAAEVGALIDPKTGQVVLRKQGEQGAVEWKDEALTGQIKGRVVIHTHPGEASLGLSDADCSFAAGWGAASVRAESIRGSAELRPGPGGWGKTHPMLVRETWRQGALAEAQRLNRPMQVHSRVHPVTGLPVRSYAPQYSDADLRAITRAGNEHVAKTYGWVYEETPR